MMIFNNINKISIRMSDIFKKIKILLYLAYNGVICEVDNMRLNYNNLFKLLIDNDLTKTEFAERVGLSSGTLAKLSKGQAISMEKLIDICDFFDCSLNDVVEIIPKDDRGEE